MAGARSNLSIHAAKMNCLAGCFESNTPFTFLFDFQEKLRSLGWQERDVEAVADGVFPLLAKDQSGQPYDGAERTLTAS
jgi:hypothetical protein